MARSLLVTLAVFLPLLWGCRGSARCCGDEGCAATSDDIVGVGGVRFRGRVPRNLLLISIDTLRRDHVGAYGGGELTPFLDQLAAEGVVATQHQTCANWTLGSMTCTLAGRTNIEGRHIPRTTGVDTEIGERHTLLAEVMAEAGFHTGVVSANDEWFSKKWKVTQGYQRESSPKGYGDVIAATAEKMLRGRTGRGDRWLLHEHYMEPHSPYNPPAAFSEWDEELEAWPTDLRDRQLHYAAKDDWPRMSDDRRALLEAHLRRLYAGDVQSVDAILEAHFAELERGCWLDDTLVVVFNDHGEAFWEHGLQAHGGNLLGEETDGVLILWARNIVPGTIDGPTSAIDLAPTLLALFDLDAPRAMTGVPLGTASDDRPLFADSFARRKAVQSVTRDGVRLHYVWQNGRVAVFDRRVDPHERRDRYDPRDPVVRELWGLLKPQTEAMGRALGMQPPAPPEGLP